MKYIVTYQGENEEWMAVQLSRGIFAVSSPKGESLQDVKKFVEDLKEYLGV